MPIELREGTKALLNALKVTLQRYWHHFAVWTAFIIYEVLITGLVAGYFSTIPNYLLHYFFNILLFYAHAFILFRILQTKKNALVKFILPFAVIIEICLYIICVYSFEIFFTKYLGIVVLTKLDFNKTYISRNIWRSLYFVGFSTGYYLLLRNQYRKQQMEEMERQRLLSIIQQEEVKNELMRTQNAYLKSQINPHFLINTLSHLYNETRKLAPKAAEGIISLSDMMQYALSKEVSTGKMRMHDEIRLIENYLYLYQARQVHPAELTLEYDDECLKLTFIPLVLMTLIENMLKHGKLDDPEYPAIIKITYVDAILDIRTSNLKSLNAKVPGHGIGLNNISDRLIQTYGEDVSFEFALDQYKYFNTHILLKVWRSTP